MAFTSTTKSHQTTVASPTRYLPGLTDDWRRRLGSSASPFVLDKAEHLLEYRAKVTLPGANDTRAIYARISYTGAGNTGDCGRFYAIANAACGSSIQGVHATAQIGSGGSIAGLMCGVRATCATSESVTTTGTLCALQVDSDLSTAISGTGSFIRVADINATNKMPYFLEFAPGVTVITTDTSAIPANATHKIKCKFGNDEFYLIGVADF